MEELFSLKLHLKEKPVLTLSVSIKLPPALKGTLLKSTSTLLPLF